jgi:hypothetical protein
MNNSSKFVKNVAVFLRIHFSKLCLSYRSDVAVCPQAAAKVLPAVVKTALFQDFK